MKVTFYAQSRQATGRAEFDLPVEHEITGSFFWARLIEIFPALAPLAKTSRLARNETYLRADELLYPQDEIAIIPAVSGG